MGVTEIIFEKVAAFIDSAGYTGIAVLMMFESMIFPIPSEAVMPFGGYLISQGRLTWEGVALASTLGSVVGSLLSYAIGYFGGKPLVQRFGRYLLLSQRDLDATHNFFERYGSWAVFIGRFVPVVRHLISIPAGVAGMPLGRFLLMTTVGASMWNMFLAWAGFQLGNHWEQVHAYSKPIDMAMVVLVLLAVAYFIKVHLARRS